MPTAAPSNLWDDILHHVRTAHPALYRGWFIDLSLDGIAHGVMSIRTANTGQHQYLEQYGTPGFSEAAQAVTGRLISVQFLRPMIEPATMLEKLRQESLGKLSQLNPDFTFENYVVGPGNRLAHATGLSVADAPGQTYNPLFLHGPPGIGKSHLLHAIARQLSATSPAAKIICLPCATYANQVMAALEQDASTPFHFQWRDADALCLDDADLLASRERSQEDFFHLFNALMDRGKQIVLAANRAPSEMTGLPDRLISRFNSGLVAMVEPPDPETRLAIVQKWSAIRAIPLPDDVATMVAAFLQDDLRDLSATLSKLDFASHRQSGRIDAALAREVLAAAKHTK